MFWFLSYVLLLLRFTQPWLITPAAPVQMAVCTEGDTNVPFVFGVSARCLALVLACGAQCKHCSSLMDAICHCESTEPLICFGKWCDSHKLHQVTDYPQCTWVIIPPKACKSFTSFCCSNMMWWKMSRWPQGQSGRKIIQLFHWNFLKTDDKNKTQYSTIQYFIYK